jgi:hypothetical protein
MQPTPAVDPVVAQMKAYLGTQGYQPPAPAGQSNWQSQIKSKFDQQDGTPMDIPFKGGAGEMPQEPAETTEKPFQDGLSTVDPTGAKSDALINGVLPGVERLGNEAAAAIGSDAATNNATDIANSKDQEIQLAINQIQKDKAAGIDTTKAEADLQALQGGTENTSAEAADVLPAANDTAGDVAGNAAGVAGDVLGFGSYGGAASGAKFLPEAGDILGESGNLTSKTAIPSAAVLAGDAARVVADKAPGVAAHIAVGKEGLATLAKISDPEVKAFVPVEHGGLGQTFSKVVDGVSGAVDSFTSTSKAALQAVKQQIPSDVKIAGSKIAQAVNDGILSSVKSNAAYHGVQGDVASIFKTPEDLINSGLLNEEEAGRVKGMVDVVKNWKDTSARGVLNLKEQLAPFYKPGLNGSNNILSGIQNNLKDVVGEVYPKIKPALAKASADIEKGEEFTKQLVGTNAATGESKLTSIARNLKNPALRGYQHSLLDDLKNATGYDALSKLKGYAGYTDLLEKGFPSKTKAALLAAAHGPAAKALGITALLGAGAGGLHELGL